MGQRIRKDWLTRVIISGSIIDISNNLQASGDGRKQHKKFRSTGENSTPTPVIICEITSRYIRNAALMLC
jgi:hypothetical protein